MDTFFLIFCIAILALGVAVCGYFAYRVVKDTIKSGQEEPPKA